MKPKDLKYPFSFETRRSFYEDGVLYVPRFYEGHSHDTWPPFENDNPVHIEFCSGNGLWIIERAQKEPNINWVAVEKDFERVRKIYSKMKNFGISNLRVVSGYGEDFAINYLKDETVDHVYVNFPDPWPKDRHAKHRIIQLPFMKEVARIIKPDGLVQLVTDDPTYAEQMRSVLEQLGGHVSTETLQEGHSYGVSWFETLWRSKGKSITRHTYSKTEQLCLSK